MDPSYNFKDSVFQISITRAVANPFLRLALFMAPRESGYRMSRTDPSSAG